jgi:menaquinone-dependent protoporphyrinogen IX oxidase
MNYKVVYFSRTGTSEKVAKKIGEKLNSEVIEITDDMNWKGPLGFVKGGMYATQNKPVIITVHGNLDNADELIVVSPVWAGHVAPAITAFQKTKNLKMIHLVTTSKGSTIDTMLDYQSAHAIIEKEKNEEVIIAELIRSLKS